MPPRWRVNIIAHGVCSKHCWVGWRVVLHIILLRHCGRICTLCFWNCKYIKVWQEWEERLILIWHLFKCPIFFFLWFFLLNWTWCSFFADTKLISLQGFRRYVSLCSFVWRNAPPYLVSKMQRLQFSVDSELMTLYDSFPHRFFSQCVQLHWIIWRRTQNCVSCAGVANVNCFLWFMQSRGLLLGLKLYLFVNVPCSTIQKVFIVEICTRKKSPTNCHRKFRGQFPSVLFTFKWVVYGWVNKFWTTDFLLEKKQEWMWGMLSEETSDDDWTSSEACP